MQVPNLTLSTDRLHLRPPRMADAPAIASAINHPDIARNTLRIPHPYTLADAETFLKGCAGPAWETSSKRPFIIIRTADQALLGICGISQPNRWQRSEIGYWIGVSYWGQGYATEAARRVIRYGFEGLACYRIQATYSTFNPASRRVQEKAGMTFEGVLRGYFVRDGEPIDVGMCAITRPDWLPPSA